MVRVLSIILLLSTTQVWAQGFQLKQNRFELKYRNLPQKQVLKFTGNLQLASGESANTLLHALRDRVERGKDLHVVLSLFGGELSLVNKVHSALKNKCDDRGYRSCRITTEVEMFQYCASACIPLFMVGDARKAAERTNWGFHQAATGGGFVMIPLMSEGVLWSKGVSRDWLLQHHQMFRTLKITWLSPHEMHGSNIITQIIPHPAK